MKQKFLLLAGLLPALVLPVILLLLPGTPTRAQGSQTVLVRFIHAYPAANAFDVYVNGSLVVNGLQRGDSTPHLRFPVGNALIEVRGRGDSPLALPFMQREVDFVTSSLGYGHLAIVFQADSFNQPGIARLEDLLNPAAPGQTRLHAIHAVPGVGAVDILTAEGAPFLQSVEFNTPIGTVDPPVGRYDFVVAPAGNRSGAILAVLPGTRLRAGFLYTIVLMPGVGGAGLETRLLSTPLLPDPAVATTLVQFAHGSSGAPAYDLYLDDTLLIPDLQPGEVLPHLAMHRGDIALSLRIAGSPASTDPAAEQTLNLDTAAVTVALLGSLEEGTFEFALLPDDLTGLDSSTARIRVINGTRNGRLNLQLNDGTVIANALPLRTSADPIDVASGQYSVAGVVDDAQLNGPLPVNLPTQPFIGGAWITVLAYTDREPRLSWSLSAIATDATSLPGFVLAAPTPTPTLPLPSPAPLQPTPAVTRAVTLTPFVPLDSPVIIAQVTLNQGVNLQCREYPTPAARSLGLIPNGAVLTVLGYAGPVDPNNGEQNTPLEPGAFTDIETTATAFAQVWLQADWISTELTTRCWIRADFTLLAFYDPDVSTILSDPASLFALMALEVPPIQRIPANYAGQIIGTGGTAPSVVTPSPTPFASATPAAQTLILGRTTGNATLLNVPNGDPLTLLPAGANLQLLGRDSDTRWFAVRYEVIGEAVYVGWLPATLVEITTPGISANDLSLIP